MNEALNMILALTAGAALGAIFFGGLWWTVRRGIASSAPAIWFPVSMLLRTAITLAGFYFVGHGHWSRMLMCLVGFLIARIAVIRLTRMPPESPPRLSKETGHAS